MAEEEKIKYTEQFPVERLEKIVINSLSRCSMTLATDSIKQKFLQSLGILRRRTSENVRYTPKIDRYSSISTRSRQSNSVSAADLRRDKVLFYTDQTRLSLDDEQVEFFDEATEQGNGFKVVSITNRYDFKTPLNSVIADSDPERRFVRALLESENVQIYDSWIKSTASRFYEIEFAWKKGEHPRRSKFSPDFFIKLLNLILVVEIKGNEELQDISEENRKKMSMLWLISKELIVTLRH